MPLKYSRKILMYFVTVKLSTFIILFCLHCDCKNLHIKTDFTEKKEFVNKSNVDQLKVGIVGAGLTGLYAALLLNALGINYEIIEASHRIGGRIYTYHFDSRDYNYVEMGAMRFPLIPEFDVLTGKQNSSLITFLNSRLPKEKQIKLIPFILESENDIFYFNSLKMLRSELNNCTKCFGFGKQNGGFVDQKYIRATATHLHAEAFEQIKDNVKKFSLKYLIENDRKTVREFLMDTKGLNYSTEIVDWMETMEAETGRYSHSIMETYFAYEMFHESLKSIEGGISKLIYAIASILNQKPQLNHRLNVVKQLSSNELIIYTNKGVKKYSDLILTPTLSVLRGVHFECSISLKKRVAMRAVNYGFAIKVGLNFKTRFWENSNLMNGKPIFGGVAFTDLPVRRVIYPSYGINCTTCPGALLASYVLSKDAKYFLSFTEKEVANIILENLATLHGPVVYEQYTGKYVVMDWMKNPYTKGAFGRFEPGDFESFFPDLIKPTANGRMHFAGDTITLYHGWSNGCLMSAFRAVKNILIEHNLNEKLKQLLTTWGDVKDTGDIAEMM